MFHTRIDNRPAALYEEETAKRLAKEMQDSDPDWTHTAVQSCEGSEWWVIETRDEEGEVLGRL